MDGKPYTRILLIKSLKRTFDFYPMTPPLGLMYLAGYLRAKGDHEIKIMDMRVENEAIEEAIKASRKFAPDAVGISLLTPEAAAAHELAAALRSKGFDGPIIFGGPHASSFPEEILEDKNVSACVIGEGEETFAEIMRGKPLSEVNGIAFMQNGECVRTPARSPINDLDAIPFPAWDLLNIELYADKLRFSNMTPTRYMPIFTSRACPYGCVYCHAIFGKKYRTRSPENVLNEMKMLVEEYGIREIEIIDDVFNFDMARAKEIAWKAASSGMNLRITFPNGIRADKLDDELLDALKAAGTYLITFAIETASIRMQKLIRKNLDLVEAGRNITKAAKKGMFTHGFFMLGFPSETREEMLETINYAIRSDLHTAGFFIVTPFKGTELARMIEEKAGVSLKTDFDNFSYNITSNSCCENVSPEELFDLQRKAHRDFHLRRGRPFRIIRDHPNKRVLPLYGVHFLRRAFSRKRL